MEEEAERERAREIRGEDALDLEALTAAKADLVSLNVLLVAIRRITS